MGEENKSKNTSSASTSRTMEGLSFEINRFPKDLLQRSMSSSETLQCKSEEEEEKEEIELNLGLSLGGRFGVDRSSKKLTRSSSIAGSIPLIRDDDAFTRQLVSYPVLMRTSSLPTETEEEWRKRKELQCLRRMEAKRRRSEKQKNLRGGGGGGGEGNLEEEKKDLNVNRINWRSRNLKRVGSGVSNTFPGFIGQQQQQQQNEQLGSLGSVDSQGGTSSSGISEMKRSSGIGEANNQSLLERNNQDVGGSSGSETNNNPTRTSRSHTENLSKKLDSAESRGKETGKNAMEEMPCVFTKGDGPNGRRVDGILYKYGKGAEIRIMCVCHGSFLSPAEFVKHAGGGDVGNPLRHIVVTSLGSSFL